MTATLVLDAAGWLVLSRLDDWTHHEAEESCQHMCLYYSCKTSQSLGAMYHLIITCPVPSEFHFFMPAII